MKKVIFTLIFSALFCSVSAQESFFTIESDVAVAKGTIESPLDQSALFETVKTWIQTSTKGAQITLDEPKGVITLKDMVQTKSSYNPFAGTFNENMSFTATFTVTNNLVTYEYADLLLTKVYVGYGSKTNIEHFKEVIEKLAAAKEALANAKTNKLSKKEKGDLEDVVDDNTVSLSKAQQVIEKQIDSLKSKIK